jgi:dodecin
MNSNVYKVVEIVGTSGKGIDDAVTNGIARASKTIENLEWFEVVETRGHIEDGKIAHVQAVLKVGFRLKD